MHLYSSAIVVVVVVVVVFGKSNLNMFMGITFLPLQSISYLLDAVFD